MSKTLVSREYHDINVNSGLDFLDWKYLINLDDIVKKAILTDGSYLEIENTGELTPDDLNNYVNQVIEEEGNNDNVSDSYLIKYLNEKFDLNLGERDCKDFEEFEGENIIIYSFNDGEFMYAHDLEFYDIYTFWDGSNWQNWAVDIEFENINSKYEEITLDEWDGRNNVTGGMGHHAYIKKLKDDKYLITETSQWQGVQDIATIADMDELIEYLKFYNRDVEKYLEWTERIE